MSAKRSINSIIVELHSQEPETRLKSIRRLKKLSMDEITLNHLEMMLEEAGKPFPEPVDEWDDPSFHLLDWVAQYPDSDLVATIGKHFVGFSPLAQQRTLSLLIEIETDYARETYIEILSKFPKEGRIFINLEELYESCPHWVPRIIKKTIAQLEDERYVPFLYRMILFCLEQGMKVFSPAEEEKITHQLVENYEKLKQNYLPYDSAYQITHVYQAWKDVYLEVREDMRLYYRLMEYFYHDRTETILQEALLFQDPFLRAEAIITLLEHGVTIPNEIFHSTAHNVESSVYLYRQLRGRSKKNFYSKEDNIQHAFVRHHLFYFLLLEEKFGVVAEELEVEREFVTKNFYDQDVSYFLVKFRSQDEKWAKKGWMSAIVGAFITEGLPTPYVYDGTTTHYEEWDKKTPEEHFRSLHTEVVKDREEYDQQVVNEYIPPIAKLSSTFLFLLIFVSFKVVKLDNPIYFILVLLPIIFFAYKSIVFYLYRKSTKLTMTTRSLRYQTGGGLKQEVLLHKIGRITAEERKWRKPEGRAVFGFHGAYIVCYGKDGEEVLSFPMNLVDPFEFCDLVDDYTDHLKDPPVIDIQMEEE